MKTRKGVSSSQKLISEIRLARIRLAKAGGQLKSAKERARLARRRRKEARQAARRAKKQVRLAKRAVAEAELVLAQAEEKLARSSRRAAGTTTRKRPRAKAAVARRRKKMARTAASATLKPVKQNLPKPVPARIVAGLGPSTEGGQQPIIVPREIAGSEAPAAPTPDEAGAEPSERT